MLRPGAALRAERQRLAVHFRVVGMGCHAFEGRRVDLCFVHPVTPQVQEDQQAIPEEKQASPEVFHQPQCITADRSSLPGFEPGTITTIIVVPACPTLPYIGDGAFASFARTSFINRSVSPLADVGYKVTKECRGKEIR